ncbi:MAG: amidase [Syntrophaceae bacterium]
MKKSKGKFIVFDVTEFAEWLNSIIVSRQIKRLQNHHTWKPSYSDFDNNNHFNLLEGMENAHLERGFSEIAQNLTTFPDDTVAVCRALDKIPAGIKGANTGGICIEHVGNFDKGKDIMSEGHKMVIVMLNALLCLKFNLQPNSDTIVYHHWYDLNTGERNNGEGTTKSCPGTNFFGGNKVADAETNLIPLVVNELSTEVDILPIPSEHIIFTGKVKSDNLNVRILPNAKSKIIKVLKKEVVVNAYEINGHWCRIDPQESYWVNSNFLEKITT